MIATLFGEDRESGSLDQWGALFLLGWYTTLVTVPLAVRLAGVDSLWRAIIGTGVGYIVGGYGSLWVAGWHGHGFLVPPLYALTMAGITTLIVPTR